MFGWRLTVVDLLQRDLCILRQALLGSVGQHECLGLLGWGHGRVPRLGVHVCSKLDQVEQRLSAVLCFTVRRGRRAIGSSCWLAMSERFKVSVAPATDVTPRRRLRFLWTMVLWDLRGTCLESNDAAVSRRGSNRTCLRRWFILVHVVSECLEERSAQAWGGRFK